MESPAHGEIDTWTVQWFAWRGLTPFALFQDTWQGPLSQIEAAAAARMRRPIFAAAIWPGTDISGEPMLMCDRRPPASQLRIQLPLIGLGRLGEITIKP